MLSSALRSRPVRFPRRGTKEVRGGISSAAVRCDSRVKRLVLLAASAALALLLLLSGSAHAETLQAPVGGKAVSIGEGRVVCPGAASDWAVEPDGHTVRPPVADDAVGRATEVKVAPGSGACATQATPLTLVATGRFPTIDPAASVLFVDDARVEVHGRGLRGVIVRW